MKNNSRKDYIKGFLALIASATIFSFYGLTIRVQAEGFSSYAQLLFRTSLALLIVLVIATLKKSWKFPKSERKWLIAFGVGNTIYPLMIIIATLNIKASSAIMMLYVGGIVTAFIIGSLFLKEKITKYKMISAFLALIGLAVFAYPFNIRGAALIGVVAGLLAGVLDASSNSLRKYIVKTPREILMITSFTTAVVLMSLAVAINSGPAIIAPVTVPVYVAMLVHAVCIVAVGYLLIYGFQHFDVNAGTIVLSSEIFISLIVNYFLLNESPTVNEFIGALIIFSASVAIAMNGVVKKNQRKILIGDLE